MAPQIMASVVEQTQRSGVLLFFKESCLVTRRIGLIVGKDAMRDTILSITTGNCCVTDTREEVRACGHYSSCAGRPVRANRL